MQGYSSDLFYAGDDFDLSIAKIKIAAEQCIQRNEHQRAVLHAKRVIWAVPGSCENIRWAAEIFYRASSFNEALDCYKRIVEFANELSIHELCCYADLLLKTGKALDASRLYLNAFDKQKDDFNLLSAAVASLFEAKEFREAAKLLLKYRELHFHVAEYWYLLAAALKEIGRINRALVAAKKSLELKGDEKNASRGLFASILLEKAQYTDALDLLSDINQFSDAWLIELKLSALKQSLLFDSTITLATNAILASKNTAGIRLHRAEAFAILKQYEKSAEDYKWLYFNDVLSDELRRNAFAVFVESGSYLNAIEIGFELVKKFPDDRKLYETLQIVIERKLRQEERLKLVDLPLFNSFDRERKLETHNYFSPLIGMLNNVRALVIRETRTRFGKSKFGYAWVIFEPLAHLSVMIAIVSLFANGRLPPIGNSFALFYFTGVVPYYLFSHTITHVMKAVPENKPLLQLPPVKVIDVFIARAILELMTQLVVSVILLTLFFILGIDIIPNSVFGVLFAFCTIWILAFGLGLLFSVIVAYFPGWERLWGAVISVIYFASGIFYVPRLMPEGIRNILSFNPVLQGIELIRQYYFFSSSNYWVDAWYLVIISLLLLGFGLVSTRLYKKKLLEVE